VSDSFKTRHPIGRTVSHMSDSDRLARAEQFIWNHARVLEQHLFRHHFHAPDRAGVLAALAGYATADGGYGYALEPDGRGPVSQPLHADFALTVLDEIGALDADTAGPICAYLASVTCVDGGLPAVHPSIRDYPRAPWWSLDGDPTVGSLAPTAHIVGLLCRNGIRHPWLERAVEFCWARVEAIEETHPYEAENGVAFLDDAPDRTRARRAADRLGELVLGNGLVLLDPDHPERWTPPPGYAPGEFHLPHDYAPRPDSLARSWFSAADVDRGLNFLAGEQHADGGWHVRFARWNPVAHTEWNAVATIRALLTLRAFGR
jgi:hypothetical protein